MLSFQVITVYSNCPLVDLCRCVTHRNEVVCDGKESGGDKFPSFERLPPAKDYYFSNFNRVQADAFKHMKFLTNESITIRLMNITTIDANAFSAHMVLPESSTISIHIELFNPASDLTLQDHAFNNNMTIDFLNFTNINSFNGNSIFGTHCFSSLVHIKELMFQQCNITGFSSSGLPPAEVEKLSIRDSPSLTQLTNDILPSFLGATKTLEISGTGLEFIDRYTFPGWLFVFQELIIKNNNNLKTFSTDIVDTFLMELDKLDLSNNSITSLNQNPDWSPYYHIQHLILQQQEKLDLFLKSNMLKSFERLKTIDFSEGFISDNDEDLIKNYVPDMPNLSLLNISYTNFTQNMVIDLLTRLSESANQTIQVSLLGHTLNDTDFCSYFQVFRQSPNLIRLELDETHECNCIVDLFFDDEHMGIILNDTLIQPTCLLNATRARCDIPSQLALSKCSVGNDNSGDNSGDIGSYAFIGVMAGLTAVLIVLLALGSSVVYRARKGRRRTILDMEYPVDNPSASTCEESITNLSTPTIEEPIYNPSAPIIEELIENPSSDTMEERLETSS